MKKIIFVLVLFVVVVVVGCSGSEANNDGSGDADADSCECDGDFVELETPDMDEYGDEYEEGFGCLSKADCEAGFFCNKDSNECVPGECFDSSDCPQLQQCDAQSHTCFYAGCTFDSECSPQRCLRSTGECVECISDSDCNGATCDLSTHTCRNITCNDDPFEQNDMPNQAVEISAGSYSKLVLCPQDADYFKLFLPVGSGLQVALSSSSNANINVALYSPENESSQPLASTVVSGSGMLEVPAVSVSDEYILVIETDENVSDSIEYQMEITSILDPSPSCVDDSMEENDTISTAAAISSSKLSNLVLCPGDRDVFSVHLDAHQSLSVNAESDYGNLDLRLLAGNGEVLSAQQSRIEFEAVQSAQYFVVIEPSSSASVRYSLELSFSSPDTVCRDDALEDNDSAEFAASIVEGEEIAMTLCPMDDDWFFLPSMGYSSVSVSLSSNANIPFEVFRNGFYSSAIGWGGSTSGDFSIQDPPDEGLVVHVIAGEDAVTNYSISWHGEQSGCMDDSFEPNNEPSEAVPIDSGSFDALMLCSGDSDYFSVTLNSNDTLDVSIDFDSSQGDLDLFLYSSDMQRVASSMGIVGTESVSYTASLSGSYYIQVAGWRRAEAAYSMNVAITSPAPECLDDPFEDNDSYEQAYLLESDELDDLMICPGDRDYFAIDLNTGDELEVGVFFDSNDGLLFARLLAPDGNTVLANADSNETDHILSTTATFGGTYILEVWGADASISNTYSILTEITRATTDCSDDTFEENDTAYAATSLPQGDYTGLVLCKNDIDWYSVWLDAGDSLNASIDIAHAPNVDFDMFLYAPNGTTMLDGSYSSDSSTEAVALQQAPSSGFYLLKVRPFRDSTGLYDLHVSVDGTGGNRGVIHVEKIPAEVVDNEHPVLFEMKFDKAPESAEVESLVLDSFTVSHSYVRDLVITVLFGDGDEVVLWDRQGGMNDAGEDDDREVDEDVEFKDRELSAYVGLPARDSLLIMVEDFGSGDSGMVETAAATLTWIVPTSSR